MDSKTAFRHDLQRKIESLLDGLPPAEKTFVVAYCAAYTKVSLLGPLVTEHLVGAAPLSDITSMSRNIDEVVMKSVEHALGTVNDTMPTRADEPTAHSVVADAIKRNCK